MELIEAAAGSPLVLLQDKELGDFQKLYETPHGALVLRRDQAPLSLRGQTRRLLHVRLRGDHALPVRVEVLEALHPQTAASIPRTFNRSRWFGLTESRNGISTTFALTGRPGSDA